jgi:hypothetical protein
MNFNREGKRKAIANEIVKNINRVKKFDVRLSFGRDAIEYELKKSFFVYVSKSLNYGFGKYKEMYFEFVNDELTCFFPLKYEDSIVGVYDIKMINGVLEEKGRVSCYPKSSTRGEHCNGMIDKINYLNDKYKDIAKKDKKNKYSYISLDCMNGKSL